MQKSQNGFVLISVLLITTISTVYAFSEIKGNRLQERIGGNQQKELNARMMAEKGVFRAFEYISSESINNISGSVITAALSANVSHAQYTISLPEYNSSGLPTLTFFSEGRADGATAHLKAKVSILPGGPNPEFKNAVVGCEGVTLAASGMIDSFNSTKGDYNAPLLDENDNPILDGNGNPTYNKGKLGNTGTVMEGANINLTGDSPINGNVEATGSFTSSGSSFVDGNVSANVDITTSVVDSNQPDIPAVTKGLNAGNDVTVNQNAKITGGINAGGTFTGNVMNGDDQLITGAIVESDYGRDVIETKTCDDKNIGAQVPAYAARAGTGRNLGTTGTPKTSWDFSLDATKNNHGVEFLFTADTAEYLNPDYIQGDPLTLKAQVAAMPPMDFLGKPNQKVHIFDSFKITDQDIVIDGIVNVLVTGDFNALNASNIKVKQGSQLNIVVLGKIRTTDGFRTPEIAVDGKETIAKDSPLKLYSTHQSTADSDYAVQMEGRDITATIRSVFGNVSVGASASIKGAIRGKKVTVSGGNGGNPNITTGVHFDEKLLDNDDGSGTYPPTIKYVSVFDHYN